VAVLVALLFLPWRATTAAEPAGAGPLPDRRQSAHDRAV
jgi:hypothetical protein